MIADPPEIFRVDRDAHVYYLNGHPVPSVTDILKDNGLLIGTEFMCEEARIRGTRVHLLCQYLDEGRYNPQESKRFGLDGYVESWRKFFVTAKYKLYNVVIDIKSGVKTKAGLWQLAGYQNLIGHVQHIPMDKWQIERPLVDEQFQFAGTPDRFIGRPDRRMVVYVKEDGSAPEVVEFDNPFDAPRFLSLVTATHIRREMGVK